MRRQSHNLLFGQRGVAEFRHAAVTARLKREAFWKPRSFPQILNEVLSVWLAVKSARTLADSLMIAFAPVKRGVQIIGVWGADGSFYEPDRKIWG